MLVQLSFRNGSFESIDPTSVGCQRVCTDSVLHALHCASQFKIRTMSLTACPKITHLGLVPGSRMMTSSSPSAFQSLRHLSLSDLPAQFSAESLISLLELCGASLEDLELRGYRFPEVLRHHSSSLPSSSGGSSGSSSVAATPSSKEGLRGKKKNHFKNSKKLPLAFLLLLSQAEEVQRRKSLLLHFVKLLPLPLSHAAAP